MRRSNFDRQSCVRATQITCTASPIWQGTSCSPHSRGCYKQWFKPYSPRRRYCQLPVSGRRMQRFLQFRLDCHGLAIATGRLAGAGHLDRANRACLACNSGAIGNERHMIFECTSLAPVRQQHADLFTPHTDTMRSLLSRTIWGF